MTRVSYFVLPVLAALVLPLAASADGLRRNSCSSCGGAGGGGGGGLFSGKCLEKLAASNYPPPAKSKNGLGFFQPPFQAAPWYLYWPYDQHFQLPAPIGAPYYPPQSLHTPWSPYFAHPALAMGGGPQGYPGFPGHPAHGPAAGGPGPAFGAPPAGAPVGPQQ